jgi:alpha-tubulin suppressor-like RCC1 family protein
MKLFLKPIQFSDFKDEIEIVIDDCGFVADLITGICLKKPEIGKSLHFMFRGKKLDTTKSLQEQGLKDGTKLMMYRSTEATPEKKDHKIEAKTKLIQMGYNNEMVDSIIRTLPEVNSLSVEDIVDKTITFLKNMQKETLSEYSLEFDSNVIKIDLKKITSVFAFGNGIQGQLGVGKYINTDIPLRVNKIRNVKVKSIACGVSHSIALTFNGHVYFWGRYYMPKDNNDDYKTGDNPLPTLCESLLNELIVEIGCGSNHSLAINHKAELFTWGEGIYGQLGHNSLDNEFYPRKVEHVKNFRFKSVKGGATHSIALTHDDYLLGWGSNEKNQIDFKACKQLLVPGIIPLYEYLGNYTIDDINSLSLDTAFKQNNNIYNNIAAKVNEETVNNNFALEFQNDLSTNVDELMRVKLLDCATWFTVCTSYMTQSIIYIFGNSYKKVVKLTFFEINKLEIKQIKASSYFICVLTDKGVYRINLNKLVGINSGFEAEKLDYLDNFDIEYIGCGYDYLLIHTNNKQTIYNNFNNPLNFKLLNSDIRCDIENIASGPSHFFLISSLNYSNLGNYLHDKITKYMNTYELDNINPDIYLLPLSSKNLQLKVPCHTFFINQFIKADPDLKEYSIDLEINALQLLIELIYTNELKVFYSEESKKIIENPDLLRTLQTDLYSIKTYLANHLSLNTNSLINLIDCYLDKLKEMLNYERVSDEFVKYLYNRELSNSCNCIISNILQTQIRSTSNSLPRRTQENEEMEEGEEGEQRDLSYFQRFEGKGTKINIFAPDTVSGESFTIKDVNLDLYMKSLVDERYQYNKKIVEIKEKLNEDKLDYIRSKLKNYECFKINFGEKVFKINSQNLSFKSLYFKNYIQTTKKFEIDAKEFGIEISENNLAKLTKFFNLDSFEANSSDIFELLYLSTYFMIDNLTALIEIELEHIISLDNVLCLLEVATDYNLFFLRRSCLFYLMIYFNEAKNHSIFKFIKDDDKTELRRIMQLNNKNLT